MGLKLGRNVMGFAVVGATVGDAVVGARGAAEGLMLTMGNGHNG